MTKKKLIALMLCIAMVCSMTVYAVGEDATCTCGTTTEIHAAECALNIVPEEESGDEPVCTCETETEIHADTCPLYVAPAPECTCATENDVHAEDCALYVAPEAPVVEEEPIDEEIVEELSYFETVLAAESVEDMYIAFCADQDAAAALTAEQLDLLIARATELKDTVGDPSGDYEEFVETLEYLKGEVTLEEDPSTLANNNVHNVTKNKWYATLSAATAEAADNNVIEVHNSFTETKSVGIQKQNLTIRAAAGKNPTISWTKTDHVPVDGASTYNCVVIYTAVTTSTTFGGSTGTLTFDASKASDDDNAGKRARVMLHCGKGTLYLKDGIVLTGGCPGGGNYNSGKASNGKPAGSGELKGELGFGSGLFMRYGTLNMSGGVIKDNYSLWGESSPTTHNYVGGGGGVYLYGTANGLNKTSMIMTGGTITHNAAGSGGGGGILVGFNCSLDLQGGTISENVSRFASGGGIGVRTQSKVTISGGLIKNNVVEGHGGGLFARGDSIPLTITGGTFEGNVAGSYGGGILFWTVGDDIEKNAVIIGGNVQIKNNSATMGGGVSIGREVLDGKPIGNKAKLVIQGNPVISGNTATENGGGIHMQSDEFSEAVNTVEISGGTFSGNKATNGGGIYVPGGTVTMTGGTFSGNEASDRGAGIFTGGGTVTLSNATFSSNAATNNGGGIYVVNGTVTMNSGNFTENKAENGGAAYVTGGDFSMYGGTMKENSASGNGGALYVRSGSFTMISGSMTENSATGDTSYGGAAYVIGGDIVIGVSGCQYSEGNADGNHTVTHTDKKHPVISGNSAQDSGGGLAVEGSGNVTMHCGQIKNNTAPNRGRGLNAYMEEGTFDFNGGDLGSLGEPELVIVGGNLMVDEPYINLEYYHCNVSDHQTSHLGDLSKMSAAASNNAYIHLPDGEKYWDAAAGYRFFGWTFFGPDNDAAQKQVRNKSDYMESGAPVHIKDDIDGSSGDGTVHMYALWAPEISNINYVGSVIDGQYVAEDVKAWTNHADNPSQYTFEFTSNIVTIKAPTMPGYAFKGWYIYQNEGQNANWGYEPIYQPGTAEADKSYSTLDYSNLTYLEVTKDDGSYDLEMGDFLFGNITLIAHFEPAFTNLTITKTGANLTSDPNQSYIFHIVGDAYDGKSDIEMDVVITGNNSVTIQHLPVGDYTITEVEDWSWRYEVNSITVTDATTISNSNNVVKLKVDDPEVVPVVKFDNKRDKIYWLDFNAIAENVFNAKNA